MKKFYLVIITVFQLAQLYAQTPIDTTISLNILQAPISPAFNLMGISPTSIDRPTDLNSFRVSVQNSSKNFTQLPSSYAVELTPASLFSPKSQTMDKFGSTKFRDIFYQTASVSFGFAKTNIDDAETDSASTSKVGIGIKFSIIRPQFNKKTEDALDKIYINQKKIRNLNDSLIFNNDEATALRKSIQDIAISPLSDQEKKDKIIPLNQQLEDLDKLIITQNKTIKVENDLDPDTIRKVLSQIVSEFKIIRQGIFLDAALGTVLDFPTQKFNYSQFSKVGAWLTGGYESSITSVSGIIRYLYQPDKVFANDNKIIDKKNITSFDYGLRLDFKSKNNKFIIGAEYLYRSVLNKNTVPSSNRFVLNTSYQVGKNQALTFTFGKNFDGSIEKQGNLITALNLLLGFGSEKTVSAK